MKNRLLFCYIVTYLKLYRNNFLLQHQMFHKLSSRYYKIFLLFYHLITRKVYCYNKLLHVITKYKLIILC